MYGNFYNIGEITDTSRSRFHRGFDFLATSFQLDLPARVQIKMRGDSEAQFTKKSMKTMFEEAEKAALRPEYVLLMVPTSTLETNTILHWGQRFNVEKRGKFRFIGQDAMRYYIIRTPSTRGLNFYIEFFTQFEESLSSEQFTLFKDE